MYGVTHCEPCEECVREEWQSIRDGALRWEAYEYCPRYLVQACEQGRGIPPPWIRERILAREGAVHLPVGGPGGVPIALGARRAALGPAADAEAAGTPRAPGVGARGSPGAGGVPATPDRDPGRGCW